MALPISIPGEDEAYSVEDIYRRSYAKIRQYGYRALNAAGALKIAYVDRENNTVEPFCFFGGVAYKVVQSFFTKEKWADYVQNVNPDALGSEDQYIIVNNLVQEPITNRLGNFSGIDTLLVVAPHANVEIPGIEIGITEGWGD